jgi:hypothetical protein
MKNISKLLFPLFCLFLFNILSCKKEPSHTTCKEPPFEEVFPSSASRWLFKPVKIGDTLNFRIYFKDKANGGKYIFRKEESFVIQDTLIEKRKEKNYFKSIHCNEWIINDYLIAKITGPELLEMELTSKSITTLAIRFKDKNFEVGDFQYNSHQSDWDDSLRIEGKKYYDISRWKGVSFLGSYLDSTYCYHNLDYGILKFIINDTLIYQRKMK